MNLCKSRSFLLILVVGCATAETLKNAAELTRIQIPDGGTLTESGKLDYETALRPAVLQKRSIANIARLLLGGNVPPNHPLVKYPEPKTWNLANNIVASLPGNSLATSASTLSGGWSQNPASPMANLQQLFETKAKLLPYTGQVAQGLTGLASVKGDLLRQIHTISTQAIAQAAAEAAARALASAAAAHAVTNSIAHSPNHGAQTGIKGGWSSYQNTYTNPPYDKTPGDMPGPPYPSHSAHINHYQPPPPSYNNNPYAFPSSTPPPPVAPTLPPPVAYQTQPANQAYTNHQQNGYYTLYNTQQPATSSSQTPYTPAPPVAHARPTLSPSTLIATTPSGYNPSLSKPITPYINFNNISSTFNNNRVNYERNLNVRPVVVVTQSSSNNTPLPSFRRTVPAGIFGRHAAQPSSTSSLLSTISSLLSASSAAYNSALTGPNPNYHHQHHHSPIQQSQPVFSNLLSSASAPVPAAPPVLSPSSPIPTPAASVLSSGITSAANIYANNGYQQHSTNPIPQGGSNYGGTSGGVNTGYVHQQPSHAANYYGATEARPTIVNPPSYSFNQHGTGHIGTNFAQSGANSYIAHAIQSSPQFSSGIGAVPAASTGSAAVAGVPGTGYGAASFSTSGSGTNRQVPGPGYSGYNGGTGPSNGHVGGWNTQHAGPSASASSWPSPSPNVYTPGYAGQTAGNFNNPSGGFGRPPAQQPVAPGPNPVQQTYSAVPQNAYQPSASNTYAQTQQPLPAPPYTQPNQYNNNNGYSQQQQQYHPPPSNTNGVGGLRNSNLNYNNNPNNNYNNNYQRYDSRDQSQSASTMGNDYYDDDDDGDDYVDEHHHSYQQAQRRSRPERPSKNSYSSSRYPNPSKKRPLPKRPNQSHSSSSNSDSRSKSSSSSSSSNNNNSNTNNKNNYRGEMRNYNGENDKRVVPTGSKKGSNFDSSVDVVDINYVRVGGDRLNDFEENPNPDKNRWRSKNPSGQRPDSFHNHNTNGRWRGQASNTKQAPSKNVHGYVAGSEKTRAEPPRAAGKNQRNKKDPDREREVKKQRYEQQKGKPKTEAAHIYGGRVRSKQQRQQQQPTKYKSRDVYTTLPEYVFRVGERPDVFVRPGGKQQPRNRVRGRLSPRFGETAGSSGSNSSTVPTTQEDMEAAYSSYIESFSKETHDQSEKTVEKSTDSTRSFFSPASTRRKEEKFVIAGTAVDETETARKDILNDFSNDSGFLTASEEFDPEEREAFVDDVYADNHGSNQRRHDYEDEQGSVQNEDYNEDAVDK